VVAEYAANPRECGRHGAGDISPIATKGEELLTEFWAKVWNLPYDLDTIDGLLHIEALQQRHERVRVLRASPSGK
jgi:hypothetical protein